jgi:plasmid stabilization system protein ParE
MDEIRIKWLPKAVGHIDDHCAFLAEKNEKAAYELYITLVKSADIFYTFPPVEPLLADMPECFRSLVVNGHYKLIYTVKGRLIEIHAVWDCRQDTLRLKQVLER